MSTAARGPGTDETDPFGTAALRASVRATWAGASSRFREDANTEEDHARGYYRDRVVVELAQNAADAATRAGCAGRLVLRLAVSDDVRTLVAANTGEPLDAVGVASLASMRASAKRPGQREGIVGRFGVGFASVRSVADDVTVTSAPGAVRFSVAATREELAVLAAADPALAAEVAARGDSLPALRLPFATEPSSVPVGCTTAIRLVLRDDEAVASIEAQLDAVGDALLLALPGLDEIRIERPGAAERVVAGADHRWLSVTRSGPVPAELLATRPVEERGSTVWSVTWAVPREGTGSCRAEAARRTGSRADDPGLLGVVHAPTPTDEPLTVPALLVASFPLDPSRRQVAAGPVTDLVAAAAGAALADLARIVPEPLDLVPTGLPAGRIDDAVREAALEALRGAPVLAGRRAAESVVLDVEVGPPLVAALGPTGLGVVHVASRHRAAARALGVEVRSLSDLIDALPAGLTPGQWRTLYAALADRVDDRGVREAVSGILVPLEDGGVTRGPRGLIVRDATTDDAGDDRAGLGAHADGQPRAGAGPRGPAALGLRVVHPAASHPLLLRLGAITADDPDVLGLPGVEAAVRAAGDDRLGRDVEPDEDWPAEIVAVLELVADVALGSPERRAYPAWLRGVPLPADDGRWHRADELAAPGSWAADHLDLPVVDVPDGWWEPVSLVLGAVGVRERLVVRSLEHVTGSDLDDADGTDDEGHADVAGWDDYDAYLTALLGEGHHLVDLQVVEDLDVVRDDAWGAVVDALGDDPAGREALLLPVGGRSGGAGRGGTGTDDATGAEDGASGEKAVPVGYAAWYLRDVLAAPFRSPAGGVEQERSAGEPDERVAEAAAALAVVLPRAPAEVAHVRDPRMLAALGAVSTPEELQRLLTAPDPGIWETFFDNLPAAGTPVPVRVARGVWAALEQACAAGLELDRLPGCLVALAGGVPCVVLVDQGDRARTLVVASVPAWAQIRAVLPATSDALAAEVADVLDLELVDTLAAVVLPAGQKRVHQVAHDVRSAVPGLPSTWLEHDTLEVDGLSVDWWVTADGQVHVGAQGGADLLRAAAHGCASAAGRWGDRHAIELMLRAPDSSVGIAAQGAWDASVSSR